MSKDTDSKAISPTNEPLFELKLGEEQVLLAPRSLDELETWVKTENEFWTRAVSAQAPQLHETQFYGQGNIVNWVNMARDSLNLKNVAAFQQRIGEIRNALSHRYNDKKAIHSSSPRAKFIVTIGDLVVAAQCLRYFLKLQIDGNNVLHLKGAFFAFQFESGLKGVPKSHEKSFVELMTQLRVEREEFKKVLGRTYDESVVVRDSLADMLTNHTQQLEDDQIKCNKRLEEMIRVSQKKIDELEVTYDKTLASQKAVTYFQKKAVRHRWTGAVIGLIAAALGVLLAGEAIERGSLLLKNRDEIGNIAIAVLVATLGFWLLRILVRSFLGQMHLATDCSSRATLMHTYLALMREGEAMKEDHRQIILSVLFRPMNDGLVKDDGTPPGFWELVTRFAGGPKN